MEIGTVREIGVEVCLRHGGAKTGPSRRKLRSVAGTSPLGVRVIPEHDAACVGTHRRDAFQLPVVVGCPRERQSYEGHTLLPPRHRDEGVTVHFVGRLFPFHLAVSFGLSGRDLLRGSGTE